MKFAIIFKKLLIVFVKINISTFRKSYYDILLSTLLKLKSISKSSKRCTKLEILMDFERRFPQQFNYFYKTIFRLPSFYQNENKIFILIQLIVYNSLVLSRLNLQSGLSENRICVILTSFLSNISINQIFMPSTTAIKSVQNFCKKIMSKFKQ